MDWIMVMDWLYRGYRCGYYNKTEIISIAVLVLLRGRRERRYNTRPII